MLSDDDEKIRPTPGTIKLIQCLAHIPIVSQRRHRVVLILGGRSLI